MLLHIPAIAWAVLAAWLLGHSVEPAFPAGECAMTGGIVALFLLAPLVIVPLGYRLLEMAAPGSRPPAVALRLMPVGAGLLVVSFWLPAGPVAAVLAAPWLAITGWTALLAGDAFRPRSGSLPAGR